MTFKEQLIITIVDKAAIGALVLIVAFGLNRVLERFKADRARENDRERVREQKQLDYIERQLSEFYYPIYIRLHIDGATWRRILDREHGNDDLRSKVGTAIETDVLLPNHEAIVAIIQSKIHLAEEDAVGFEAMLDYVRHVAVYRAMRGAGCFDRDPIALGEPSPKKFLPIIERTTYRLQQQYDRLLDPALKSAEPVNSLEMNGSEGVRCKRCHKRMDTTWTSCPYCRERQADTPIPKRRSIEPTPTDERVL